MPPSGLEVAAEHAGIAGAPDFFHDSGRNGKGKFLLTRQVEQLVWQGGRAIPARMAFPKSNERSYTEEYDRIRAARQVKRISRGK